jgi:hypothetical protein
MKQKLSCIRSPWGRLLITALINLLYVFGYFSGRRARVHWIGYRRYRRRERVLTVLLFASAMLCLNPEDFAFWSTLTGGMMSIFLVLHMVYWFFPRKRAHWVRYRP